MLLTITNTKSPATDMGYLLHKNPNRLQSSELSLEKSMSSIPKHQPIAAPPLCCSTLTPWGLCVLAVGRLEKVGCSINT
jgi:hypothetical protein